VTVSVRDVAVAASVSVGTVSNVLNNPDRVAPATVARVMAAIDALGFVRNDAARQLRAGQSRTIGLIVLDVGNPFFTDLARGAEERASADNLTVLLANSDENQTREAASLDLFEEQRVLGVVISPLEEDLPRLRRLSGRGIQVVLVDRDSSDRSVSSVSVDDIVGGGLAAGHLAELGRRRLAFVGGPHSIRQVSDRLTGTLRVIAEHRGMTLEVLDTSSLTVLEGRAAGATIAARPPDDRPDAVFAANDLLAIGLMQSFRSAGIAMPGEIAVIGYDDIDFAVSAEVPLSSIRQPSWLLGHTAVDLLLKRVAEPELGTEHIKFQPVLVVRESTAGRAID
jgi:LacI family transcriptional regulator